MRRYAGWPTLPADLERVFFYPDVHAPFHRVDAWQLVLRAQKDFKPDTVVTLGDFVDFFSISRWSKDPARAMSLADEVGLAQGMLDEIVAASPSARRIYLGGNHEDRLQRYLQDKAPELFEFIDVPKLLKLAEKGFEYVPYKQAMKIGKLHLTHDVGTAGRYAVYKALDAFQHPVVTVHTHRLAYVVEGDATGDCQVSAQFGWLGDVDQIDYLHAVTAKRNWALGFGYGYIDRKTGFAYLVPVPIVNGTAIVEGRYYEAAKRASRKKAA